MRYVLASVLALMLSGCSWLAAQDFEVCTDYKGYHVCVGRSGGAWTFKTDRPLSPEDEDEIKRQVGEGR